MTATAHGAGRVLGPPGSGRPGVPDGGAGVGLVDAMNVVLAAAFRTVDLFTADRHFRMMRPLTGRPAFRLRPDDL
ncbi:hypothetical protein [Streptomyces sp. JNUCC 63]